MTKDNIARIVYVKTWNIPSARWLVWFKDQYIGIDVSIFGLLLTELFSYFTDIKLNKPYKHSYYLIIMRTRFIDVLCK